MKHLVFLILVSQLIACNLTGDRQKGSDTSSKPGQLHQTVSTVASYVDKKKPASFRVETIRVQHADNLRAISFSDEMHGWVGGDRKLYMTEDGGKIWKEIPIKVPAGADIQQILFVSPTLGWVVLQRAIVNVLDYQTAQFWLMYTNDAGNSWHLQHWEKQASNTQLSFTGQNGWLIGARYLAPAQFTYLILRTRDQGQHWTDVSGSLKRTAKTFHREISPDISVEVHTSLTDLNDGIMSLVPVGDDAAKIVTARRVIFLTSDNGINWVPIGFVQEVNPRSGIRRLGENNTSLWFAASTDGIEGTRGVLMTQQLDHSWLSYQLTNVYFADVLSLESREFVAYGFVRLDAKSQTPQQGIILHSNDNGKTWLILHQSTQVNTINAATGLGSDLVLAVGSGGLFIRAQRYPKVSSITGKNLCPLG